MRSHYLTVSNVWLTSNGKHSKTPRNADHAILFECYKKCSKSNQVPVMHIAIFGNLIAAIQVAYDFHPNGIICYCSNSHRDK